MGLSSFQLQLADIQGRLFELAHAAELDSVAFISAFMVSPQACGLDREYDRMQWAGEEYILEDMLADAQIPQGKQFSKEAMYWTGYIYRYWHFLTGESSPQIYSIADAQWMNQAYQGLHTLSPEMTIEDIRSMTGKQPL